MSRTPSYGLGGRQSQVGRRKNSLLGQMLLSTVQSTALYVHFLAGPCYSPVRQVSPTHFTGEETEALEAKWLFQAHTINNWQKKKFQPGLTLNPSLIPPNQPWSLPPHNQSCPPVRPPQPWFMVKNLDGNERMQKTRQVGAHGRVGKEKQ